MEKEYRLEGKSLQFIPVLKNREFLQHFVKKQEIELENSIQDISYNQALYEGKAATGQSSQPVCQRDHILVNRIHYAMESYCLDSRECEYKKIDLETNRQYCTFFDKK